MRRVYFNMLIVRLKNIISKDVINYLLHNMGIMEQIRCVFSPKITKLNLH